MSVIPPSPISKSCGLSVCLVLLIFITDSFLLSIVGSKLRTITLSVKNSDMPSRERREEPIGSSDVTIDVDFAVSNALNI